MCGFEEVTHAPEPAEYRPTPTPDPNATVPTYIGREEGLDQGEQALLGGNHSNNLKILQCGSRATVIATLCGNGCLTLHLHSNKPFLSL